MNYLLLIVIVFLVYLLIKNQRNFSHNTTLADVYMMALVKELGVKKGMEAFFRSLDNNTTADTNHYANIWKEIGQKFNIPIIYEESGYLVSDATREKVIQILEAYEKPSSSK